MILLRKPTKLSKHLSAIKETLLEYVDTSDKDEVKLCFEELKEEDTSKVLYDVFEVSISQRKQIQNELNELVEWLFSNYFKKSDWENCCKRIENNMENFSMDFPLAPRLLNEWNEITHRVFNK